MAENVRDSPRKSSLDLPKIGVALETAHGRPRNVNTLLKNKLLIFYKGFSGSD